MLELQSELDNLHAHEDEATLPSAGSAAEASAERLHARADQAAKNAVVMAATSERAIAVAKALATASKLATTRLGRNAKADMAIIIMSAISDATGAAGHSAIEAGHAAVTAERAAVETSAAATAERAAVEVSAAAAAGRTTVEASAASAVKPTSPPPSSALSPRRMPARAGRARPRAVEVPS